MPQERGIDTNMKKTKIADCEMYSINIAPLTTKHKKKVWLIKNGIRIINTLLIFALTYAVVTLYLIVNVK